MVVTSLLLALLGIGCSEIHNTPSAIILKHYQAQEAGDITTLRATMTRDAFLALVEWTLPHLSGEGKVFAYDSTHYASDPVSLRRLEPQLSEYFKRIPRAKIKLISEKAVDESTREIYLELNGKKEVIRLVDIDSHWKIAHLPGE